ncbi:unnamed protein product [Haemonchus placei]|uniref:Uncharacterized protein n=1 Tax=Haemonchus placei TaxID=6290 RepID=A0A3P7SQI7_HAEPC|nr:unnamed protein product [Haemonchus placei]
MVLHRQFFMVEKTKSKQQQPTKRDNSKSSQVGTTPRLTEERETLRQTRKKKKLSKLITAEEPVGLLDLNHLKSLLHVPEACSI